jgi:hypothetical protein
MLRKDLAFDEFLRSTHVSIQRVSGQKEGTQLTLMVNRLYGNMRGIKLKKLSLYSFSLIALSATPPSTGRIPGGNLPFGSQFSTKHVHVMRTRTYPYIDRHTPFEMATLSSSMAASRSGWKGCCDREVFRGEQPTKRNEDISYTYDVYYPSPLLPVRALRRPRPALLTGLLPVGQKRNRNVLHALRLWLRMTTMTQRMRVIARTRDGLWGG